MKKFFNKKVLVTTALALVLALVGATFAWFTVPGITTGIEVEVKVLEVNSRFYEVDWEGNEIGLTKFEVEPGDYFNENVPLFLEIINPKTVTWDDEVRNTITAFIPVKFNDFDIRQFAVVAEEWEIGRAHV